MGKGIHWCDWRSMCKPKAKVVDLINNEQSTWKMEVLGKLFDEDQVCRIMAIPVVGFDIKDTRVSRGDNIGVYSAKSGYKWKNKKDTTILQRDIIPPPMDLQTLELTSSKQG